MDWISKTNMWPFGIWKQWLTAVGMRYKRGRPSIMDDPIYSLLSKHSPHRDFLKTEYNSLKESFLGVLGKNKMLTEWH